MEKYEYSIICAQIYKTPFGQAIVNFDAAD